MPSASAPKRLPSRSASGRNGRTVSDASAALTFTANGTNSPARARPTCSAIVSPALSCASRVLAPRCGVTTTSRQVEQRRLGGRLAGEHVERGAADAAVADGVGQGRLVDDAAARHVDDAHARLGLGEAVGVDQADRLGRLDDVEGDEVGGGGQLVEVDQLDVELAGPLGGHERVVGDDPHAERAGPLRDELADAAEADDAEGLVGQLDALPLRALPPAVDERLRGPAGRCGPGPAASPSCARRPRGCSTAAR